MPKFSRQPSSYFPDYLKLDLALGMENAHPLAKALDESIYRISEIGFQATCRLHPALLSLHRQKMVLMGYGFKFDVLKEEEISHLYEACPSLFHDRGSLSSIQTLAKIYLGECKVRRGRPFPMGRLPKEGAPTLSLSELGEGQRVVFVRMFSENNPTRILEFVQNCRCLLPAGYELEVGLPTRPKQLTSQGIRLGKDVRMEQRRI